MQWTKLESIDQLEDGQLYALFDGYDYRLGTWNADGEYFNTTHCYCYCYCINLFTHFIKLEKLP